MFPKRFFPSVILLIGLMAACGPSAEEKEASSTAEMISQSATLAANAPTKTPAPTNTPTPVPTNTPTPRPTATSRPTETPSPPPPSALEIMENAEVALSAAESFRQTNDITMTLDFEGLSLEMIFNVENLVMLPDRIHQIITITYIGETTVMELIKLGDKEYFKDEGSNDWIVDSGSLLSASELLLPLPGVEDLTYIDQETVDGVTYHVIEGGITDISALGNALAGLGEMAESFNDVNVRYSYWIEQEKGLPLRIEAESEMKAAMEIETGTLVDMNLSMDSTTSYSDYGAQFEIKEPLITDLLDSGLSDALTECDDDALRDQVLIIAVENDWYPFNYYLEGSDTAVGYDYDIFEEICQRLGCEPVFVETDWDTFTSILDGQSEIDSFDVGADGLIITEERARHVSFSEPYIESDRLLLVRKDDDRFSTVEEFVGSPELIIGEYPDSFTYDLAIDLVGEERTAEYGSFPQMFYALLRGDVDGAVVDELSGAEYVSGNPEELRLLEDPVGTEALGFIFPKDSDIRCLVNSAIESMRDDGKLDELFVEWFLIP